MKLAFIVQRYGPETGAGIEHLCRLVAEHLATEHEVEVLTTCARDAASWENVYAEGFDRIRGVTVRRFANAAVRDMDAFNRYSAWIYSNRHSRSDELRWLQQQGPWCPALVEWLRRNHQQYDVLTFFTYLHAPTVMGLDVNPSRSVVVSAARDEPAMDLGIFKDVFKRPAALCYLTDSERLLVQSRFRDRPLIEEVVGVGIDTPHQPYSGVSSSSQHPVLSLVDDDNLERRPYLAARGSTFRRRHRLHGPVVLYGGRLEPGRGCEELIEHFSHYVADGGEGSLTLMGVKMMSLPEEPWIRFAGLLSDAERHQALEAATVVVCPSADDSLSLLALEAMAVGTPVLANAQSAALVEHCRRGNSGLYYADGDEFVECLKLLVDDPELRDALGRSGWRYVRANHRWDVVLDKLARVFAQVRNAR